MEKEFLPFDGLEIYIQWDIRSKKELAVHGFL